MNREINLTDLSRDHVAQRLWQHDQERLARRGQADAPALARVPVEGTD